MLIDFKLFRRNKNFALLYFGQFVSFLGTMITSVALPFQIYATTHSTLMVGLLSLAQLVPLLFTALLGGVLADRLPRKKLLIATELILITCSLGLAFNVYLNHAHLVPLFVLAVTMSAVTGLHRPALDSIVQQIVDKDDFATVGSLAAFKSSLGMILGPAIGGILIAHYGLTVTYLADFLTFALSLIALLLMTSIPKPAASAYETAWSSLVSGCRYAVSRQELTGSYAVDFIAMIFGMPTALFPAIAFQFGGAQVLGALYAAPAIGSLLMAFCSHWVKQVRSHGKGIAIAAGLWSVCIIFFGLSHNFYWALFFIMLSGAFDTLSGIFRSVLWNQTIPNQLRGRLAGIEMISYISGPKLGDTEAGLVAAAFGVTTSIVAGGLLSLAGIAVCCYLLPRFWHYRAR